MAYQFIRSDGTPGTAASIGELEAQLRARLIGPDTPVHDTAANVRAKAAALIVFAKKNAAAGPPPPPAPMPAPRPVPRVAPKPVPPTADKEPKVGQHQAIAVLIVFIAIAVAGAAGVPPQVVGDLAAPVFIGTLVLLGILRLFLGGKTPRQRVRLWYIGAVLFSVVMVSPAVLAPFFAGEREASEKAAMKALAESTRASLAQMEAAEKGLKPAPTVMPAAAYDDRSMLGKVAPLTQARQAEDVREYGRFKAFEEKSGIEGILEPGSFVSPAARAHDRGILVRYVDEFEAYVKRSEERDARFRAQVAAAIGPGRAAEAFLSGMDRSLKAAADIERESLANHRTMLKVMEEMHAFIAALPVSPRLENGRVSFETDDEVARFKAFSAKFKDIGAREEALEKRREALNRKAIDVLDRGAEKGLAGLRETK